MGYDNVREYPGGLSEWRGSGGAIDGSEADGGATARSEAGAADRSPDGAGSGSVRESRRLDGWVDVLVTRRSIGQLLGAWLLISLAAGVVYWAAETAGANWIDGLGPGGGVDELLTAIYFSFVSALSIGYGDLVPVGPARVLAVLEGAAGLLIFGCVISKLVSRRQEQMLEDTHRITFEDRLGRVRTNLHLVLGELHDIAEACAREGATPDRVLARGESAAAVFDGELQAIHDLLYRPRQRPDEQVLESILASLVACMQQLLDLLDCLPVESGRSRILAANLRHLRGKAVEICADCVPDAYAPDLREWMDRVRELAERIPEAGFPGSRV